MKSIYIIIANLSSGGAERVISILSNKFVVDGYNIKVLMWYNKPVFYKFDNRVKIVSLEQGCQSKNIIKKMLWLRKMIKSEKPKLVLSFLAIFNILTLISLIGISTKKLYVNETIHVLHHFVQYSDGSEILSIILQMEY